MPLHELICTEIWGGNGNIFADLHIPGLRGVIYSNACGGDKGGDVYYATACSSGLIGRLCLADVAGHGEQVAQVSGWLHDVMRGNMERRDPSRVFSAMNRKADEYGLDALTTAVCIHYHALRAELRYCNAGHPPALVYRRSDPVWKPLAVDPVPAAKYSNLPFGVGADTKFGFNAISLGEGARLFAYSDGITETTAPDSRTLFGEERLIEALTETTNMAPRDAADHLLARLRAFAGADTLTHDDVTFILLEVEPHDPRPFIFHLVRNQFRKLTTRLLHSE
jgi:sigma-B regulation protein RsbU (phosphoserine phosphatase)